MTWLAYPIRIQIQITEMYSLFENHYECGYEFPGESHNFWECLYVRNGEVCVSGNERVYNLTQGSIIFHKPLEFHKFTVTGQEGADLLIFSFSAQGPLTAYLKEKVFALSKFQRGILSSMLTFLHEKAKEPAAKESAVYLRYLNLFPEIPTCSQMLVTYLYQLMLSLAETGAVFSVSSAPDAIVFGQAISYLNENIGRQPTIPELSRHCNVSEASLKRIFDKYAGIGVHKYLLKLKIQSATDLLRHGESVSSVAEKLGFNNQSYFSRAYKRETGVSPSRLSVPGPR